LSISFVIVWGLFVWKRICAGLFIVFVIYLLSLEIQLSKGRVGIPLTGLIPPHFCVGPKPGSRFPKSYVVVFFVFSEFG